LKPFHPKGSVRMIENIVRRKFFPEREEVKGAEESYVMRRFIICICTLHQA
jgi:hypothetical protein